MKHMKQKGMLTAGAFAALCAAALTITACDHLGTINQLIFLNYSIEVDKRSLSRAVTTPSDTVELYLKHFEYAKYENEGAGMLILIANGDRDIGTKGSGKLNNAGWYSVNEDLQVQNDVNNAWYSMAGVEITKLRVNGIEYEFPGPHDDGKEHTMMFGKKQGFSCQYPNNFSGFTLTDTTKSLKTIITVEPDILTDEGVLADDPYLYIKVEGRLNE